MTALSQEEILQSTRTVVQGLEALKEEHEAIKVSSEIFLEAYSMFISVAIRVILV